jgi:predicted ATPase/class 3 adenylate cyclase
MTVEPSDVARTGPLHVPRGALLTFLVADIRGYTGYTVERGDEAAARLADRFAGLCEDTAGRHEGQVLELRGDEALCVFSSARNALRAAVALQAAASRAMEADPTLVLNVGIGLDAGEPVPVRGGYRGGALNLASRLCSIAGAGEILASETVTGLARKTDDLAYRDRGPVTLKGFPAPVAVLQIAREGSLPDALPPLQPLLVAHPNNLPDEPTPFIGREQDIQEVRALLRTRSVRLVTLTGLGGTGKSRLALQVANSLLYAFRDGVFFCDLSSLSDPALVLPSIASTLEISEEAGKSVEDTLIDHMRDRELLLLLDNFEQLLEAAPVATRLLDACRELRILVTSRVPLHLIREHDFEVAPLLVPDPASPSDVATLSRFDSVALFVERARAARHQFALSDENATRVAEICARLDGLPLAIELAAAWVKLFPPSAILDRLSDRLTLLPSRQKDRPSRQQTLLATLDWSYDLLPAAARTLFARLAVFSGGFTLDAAEALVDESEGLDVLDGLASLADASLVRQANDEEPRFGMLEMIRAYADRKLEERAEAEVMRRRHAEHMLALAQSACLIMEAEGPMRHDLIIRERDNIRSALSWSCQSGQTDLGLELLFALENIWVTTSPHEGERWLDDLLARAPRLTTEQRARVLRLRGNHKVMLGLEGAAIPFYAESLEEYRKVGDDRCIGILLQRLAQQVIAQEADAGRARDLLEESLALHRESGFTKGEATSLGILANIVRAEGSSESALQLYARSAELARETGFAWWEGGMGLHRAKLLLELGRPAESLLVLQQTLPLLVRIGNRQYAIYALALCAQIAAQTGDRELAGRVWGAIEAEERKAPVGGWETERAGYEAVLRAHGGPEFERGRSRGRSLSLNEIVEHVLQAHSPEE